MSNDAFPIYAESLDAQRIDAIAQDKLEAPIRAVEYIRDSVAVYGVFINMCKRKESALSANGLQQIKEYEDFRTKAQNHQMDFMLAYLAEKNPTLSVQTFKDML